MVLAPVSKKNTRSILCDYDVFIISFQNDKSCQPGHRCKRDIEIYMGDVTVEAKRDAGGPVVTFNGAPVAIPSNKAGLIFEQISQYIVIRSNIGFTVSQCIFCCFPNLHLQDVLFLLL